MEFVELAAPQSRFSEVLEELKVRVDGELAFAVVPREPLIGLLERLGISVPLHLVVPREVSSEGHVREAHWEGKLRNVASTNVQPGRGDSEEDWDDCEAWLDEITEIEFWIDGSSEPGIETGGEVSERPVVRFAIDSGETVWQGFSSDEIIQDPVWNQVVDDLFGEGKVPEDLDEVMRRTNLMAGNSAPSFRFLESGSLFLNLSPSIILALGAALVWSATLTAILKFSAALLATLAALGLKQVRSCRRWLHGRTLAEICRSISHSGDILDPLFPPAAHHLPSYASFTRSFALAKAEAMPVIRPDAIGFRNLYLNSRLKGDKGQIAYYTEQARSARFRRRWIRGIFQVATVLALISTVFALASLLNWLPGTESFNQRWVAGFATFAFPAMAAAAIGYLGLSETARRADYYEEIVRLLRNQEKILRRLRSEGSIMEAVRKTESLLLEEFSGWLRRRTY
ncbi:MAG: hypothetical protein KDN20_15570 [Verrucomicrobiae bacterium]|nr:hypothetical protein [Verrucomicrobiae bacterium]